jgi:hypothetical protein
MLPVLKHVKVVRKIPTTVTKDEKPVVSRAMPVRRRKPAVPNAKPVVLARTAMVANNVPKVDTAMAAILLRCRAGSAQRGTTTTTLAKVRVCRAVLGNSTMLPVLEDANLAQNPPILVIKAEHQSASIVPLDGRPKSAVPNASRAVRGRLAMDAKIARWVLPEQETTKMPLSANNVNWVKQQLWKVRPNATLVILDNLAKPEVLVPLARLDFIKLTNARNNASSVRWEKGTLVPKRPAVIVTKDNLEASMALVQHAHTGFFKIPKVKQNAVNRVPRQEKYPTTNARDVNCHRGVLAKWGNI